MKEQRAVVLMFHRDWDVSRSRAVLLRALNPGLPVHGIYGGDPGDYAAAAAAVGPALDSIRSCDIGDGRWRWQHTDLVLRDWYEAVGHKHPFDVLHVLQWDLLLFDRLDRLYAHVPPGAVALTGITPIEMIAERWHWTRVEPHRTENEALFAAALRQYDFRGTPKACLGPGTALPRSFLDRYVAADIPQLGHDEVRLPLYAEIFGHTLVDTGFYPKWFDDASERLFNANGAELSVSEVADELTCLSGRRTFHPCRESFNEDMVTAMTSLVLPNLDRAGA